jgi:hypothetical protein
MMKWSDLPLKPTHRMLRQFAAAWLVLFLAMGLRQALGRGHTVVGYGLCAIALIGVVGLVRPGFVRWLFIGATIVAFPIGWVVTLVTLGVMFYLVLTAVALLFRLRRRDELQLRCEPERTSYWVVRDEPSAPERYLKQF